MQIIQKAVIKKSNQYLILKRSPDAHVYPDHWDLPGGKLEENEEPKSGIKREVFEETGLRSDAVSVLKRIPLDPFETGNATHRFDIFEVSVDTTKDIQLSDEHTDWQWANSEEILKLEAEPYFEALFEELR